MILTQPCADSSPPPPRLIKPRDHTASICIWSDLSVDDVDRLLEVQTPDQVKRILAEIFHLDDFAENLKSAVLLDLYYYTIRFALENGFTREKLSTLFSIVKKTHEVCTETPFGNVDQTFNYFKELILCHSVNRPPLSIEVFTTDEVKLVTEYVIHTYFRHFKLYKYTFTPLVRLDLSLNYIGIPVTPPPSEAEEAPEEAAEVEAAAEEDEEKTEQAVDIKVEEAPESNARKELRSMIQHYLAEEIKKMKISVDERIRSTEDHLNTKLDQAETNGSASGKKTKPGSGKGSAKGKRK